MAVAVDCQVGVESGIARDIGDRVIRRRAFLRGRDLAGHPGHRQELDDQVEDEDAGDRADPDLGAPRASRPPGGGLRRGPFQPAPRDLPLLAQPVPIARKPVFALKASSLERLGFFSSSGGSGEEGLGRGGRRALWQRRLRRPVWSLPRRRGLRRGGLAAPWLSLRRSRARRDSSPSLLLAPASLEASSPPGPPASGVLTNRSL